MVFLIAVRNCLFPQGRNSDLLILAQSGEMSNKIAADGSQPSAASSGGVSDVRSRSSSS